MTFDDFRAWALSQTADAARRWEDPRDDSAIVLMGEDDYGAFHLIPMPPIYDKLDRAHDHWLAGAGPDIVANRSLRRVAFRAAAWTSADPRYSEQPKDDPSRGEILLVDLSERDRSELWQAPIKRSANRLPTIGEWECCWSEEDGPDAAPPNQIRAALKKRGPSKGPTMPAAEMVLGPWDVPPDMFPVSSEAGPLDFMRDGTSSTFKVLYRPESPGPVIGCQAIVFEGEDGSTEFMRGALESLLVKQGGSTFTGPELGTKCEYVESKVQGQLGELWRYTALWRYPFVVSEVAIFGPPGRYTKKDIYRFAAIQDKRATLELAKRQQAG